MNCNILGLLTYIMEKRANIKNCRMAREALEADKELLG